MTNKTKKLKLLGLGLLLAVLGTACSVERVNEAEVGVYYTDGWIEGQKFERVVEPGGSATVWNDNVYKLPARQVSYIAAGASDALAPGADGPSIIITDKDGVKLRVDMTVRFFLNSREEALKPFFLEQCQKYDCWEGVDDADGTDTGWGKMLRDIFGNTAVTVANDIGLDYTAVELRYNNETKDEFSAAFAAGFVESQERLIGRGDYFCGPGYKRGDENSCPALSVEINKIVYANDELEGIRQARVLADEQVELAEQQEAAAAAQARVDAALATPEHIELQEAKALNTCAGNPSGCNLTVIVGSEGVGVSVPAS